MKLRNKKTGELGELTMSFNEMTKEKRLCVKYIENHGKDFWAEKKYYTSLAELNEKWEDYEEPKEKYHWFISGRGTIEYEKDADDEFNRGHKSLGNYFEAKEEAERAVEKLKAWKRLKEKGLEVTDWGHGLYLEKNIVGRFRYEFPIDNKEDIEKDLDSLFGGEE